MTTKLFALGALMATASQSASGQGPTYPLEAVLNQARAACARPAFLTAMDASLRSKGWQPYEVDPSSPLGEYIASTARGGGAVDVSFGTFRATVAGRPLIAFIAQLDLNIMNKRSSAVSCEIFDPEASGPVTEERVRRWAGRKPMSSHSSDGLIVDRWVPGLTRGSDETAITFIPRLETAARPRSGLTYSVTARLTERQQ